MSVLYDVIKERDNYRGMYEELQVAYRKLLREHEAIMDCISDFQSRLIKTVGPMADHLEAHSDGQQS